MSIIFQKNKVIFFSDTLLSLAVQDETLEANGEPQYISGGVHSVIAVDKDKKTWMFTVPTWQYLILTTDQYVHIEGQQRLKTRSQLIQRRRLINIGPQEYTESGATYVCLNICNSGGSLGFFTRQISSNVQLAHTRLIGKVWGFIQSHPPLTLFQELGNA